jgi:hypothetical protein
MSYSDRREVSDELDRLTLASRNTRCYVAERIDAPGVFYIVERCAPAARPRAKFLLCDASFQQAMDFVAKSPRRENSTSAMSDTALRNAVASRGLVLQHRPDGFFDLAQGARFAGRRLSRVDVESWLARDHD